MSLIASACPSGSPASVGSSWTLPFLQMTGLNCKTSEVIEGSQVGSGVAISACPATWPRLLTPAAKPLLPPNVGSGVITPFCQRNGRHIRWVPKKQKSSPNGSGVKVSAPPPTLSLSLGRKDALLFGPPSVPRSVITPFCQRKACVAVSPGRVELPVTEPLLLMPPAKLNVPPNVPRSVTV